MHCTLEQIAALLREVEAEARLGGSIESICRKRGIPRASYYTWRKKYLGMSLEQIRHLH
jgi:transposase-like protein